MASRETVFATSLTCRHPGESRDLLPEGPGFRRDDGRWGLIFAPKLAFLAPMKHNAVS
jgi:hypothetical protein